MHRVLCRLPATRRRHRFLDGAEDSQEFLPAKNLQLASNEAQWRVAVLLTSRRIRAPVHRAAVRLHGRMASCWPRWLDSDTAGTEAVVCGRIKVGRSSGDRRVFDSTKGRLYRDMEDFHCASATSAQMPIMRLIDKVRSYGIGTDVFFVTDGKNGSPSGQTSSSFSCVVTE
jgi:uncharacterized protein YcaQ